MHRPAIVAIGYDRPEALKRLLLSVEAAEYAEGTSPVLIISIDKSDSDDVVRVAEEFEYSHGRKIVMARNERMGLREHVLSCGDLVDEYESIIVLEDDIFVSPCFYSYACEALEFSDKDDRIGAISLYDHRFNVHVRESFCAIDDGYDNYYLQIASSWGQAYTRKQWKSFRSWYEANRNRDLSKPSVPSNITGWSDRSWLKYYIVYLIETGQFCLYPRISLTTNFGDAGTHEKKNDTDLQVPVAGKGNRSSYVFSTLHESHAVYDSFFEPVAYVRNEKICFGICENAEKDSCPLIMDLYGIKQIKSLADESDTSLVLSSRLLPYSVKATFGRQMRPIDANIVYNIAGNDFYLYDLDKSGAVPGKHPEAFRLFYEYKGISAKRMMRMIGYRIREKIFGN